MFVDPTQNVTASNVSPAPSPAQAGLQSTIPAEFIRHTIFDTPPIVKATIQQLHKRGYAEPNDWSRTLSTGRPG